MWNVRVLAVETEINKYFETKEYAVNFVRGLTYLTIKHIQVLEYVFDDNKWYIRFEQCGE